MPANGLQGKRIKIMNELFRSMKGYTKNELIEIVGERIKDYRTQTEKLKAGQGITGSSIDKDLRFMREQLGAEIECVGGRYKYSNPNFTTEGATLDPDEIANVKVAAALIKNIPGFELYNELKDIIRKLEMQAGIEDDDEQIIQFDTRLGYSGNKHITRLFEAITCKQVIRFLYKDFQEQDASEVMLHPYLLKEFNNRWSLIGVTEKSRKERTHLVSRYGLERIFGKIKPAEGIDYYKHYDFDPDTYLKDIIGVSLNAANTVENVVLKFSEKRAPYIETNPLHHSQKLVEGTTTTYSLKIIPNKELEALILYFGPDVEVLEPYELRVRIAGLILDASKMYF